jgi:hypothetical protein
MRLPTRFYHTFLAQWCASGVPVVPEMDAPCYPGATSIFRLFLAHDLLHLLPRKTAGLNKQAIRKTISVLAMLLDHGRIEPNPARDKLTVKMPREERRQVQPPTAEHVEVVVRLLRLATASLPACLTRVE